MSAPLPHLGIFLPERPAHHRLLDPREQAIGCVRAPLRDAILQRLRAHTGIRLRENLNFQEAVIVNGQVYVDDFCLNDLDRFFWYGEVDRRPGSFDLEVLQTLERDVEVIRPPGRFALALDKYQAHLCLRDAGVQVAEFALFDHRFPGKMEEVLNRWGRAVLKPRRGGWGKGVSLIDSPARLRDLVGYVRSTQEQSGDQGFFLERFYPNDPARWASITLIEGQIAYGYRKLPEKFVSLGEGLSKVEDIDEIGGGVVLADLNGEQEEQALRAAEALGLGLIGFDMIWTEEGPVIVDENTSPGNYPDMYAAVGKDPAKLFADWILRGL